MKYIYFANNVKRAEWVRYPYGLKQLVTVKNIRFCLGLITIKRNHYYDASL